MPHPFAALLFLVSQAGDAPTPAQPEILVDLADIAPNIEIDMRYAGAENFVGAPIDGYEAPRCLLTREAAAALAAVQSDASKAGLALRVYDCYRPQRAVDHFVRWAADPTDARGKRAYYPNIEKTALFAEGYIAERSGHSRGSTVDLTVVGLDMGAPYDLFDPISRWDSEAVAPEARANRYLLRLMMKSRGFKPYDLEWWHFTLEQEPYTDRYFDMPIEPRRRPETGAQETSE